MRISRLVLSRQNVFSSCVDTFFNKSSNWSSIDQLISGNDPSSDSRPSSPKTILNLAQKGLKFQVFDASFWNRLYDFTVQSKDSFSPSQWVQLLHIYKRIKIRNSELYDIAMESLNKNLSSLSLKDLSLLSLSFSYFSFCPNALFTNIAKTVCSRHQSAKMKELEETMEAATSRENSSSALQSSRKLRTSETVSYVHLLGAYAKCGYDNRELFEVATEELVRNMSQGDVTISPNLIMKLLESYSRFSYRHKELLEILSSQVMTSKLSSEDLLRLKSIFSQLNYENETVERVLSYRLGNVK